LLVLSKNRIFAAVTLMPTKVNANDLHLKDQNANHLRKRTKVSAMRHLYKWKK